METANAIGLSRQIVLGRALNIAANNIANQNTTGFKAERFEFREYLVEAQTASSTNVNDISLVIDPASSTDFTTGTLSQTDAPLDFAITGDGFFAVETQNGTRYTRDGHFGVSSFGELVTRNGDLVLDDQGAPILLDAQGESPILTAEGELQQGNAPIARLGVYTFENDQALLREGSNLFRANTGATTQGRPNIAQGFLEQANVQALQGITQLINISRAYSQAAELVQTSHGLSREAIRTLTDTNS